MEAAMASRLGRALLLLACVAGIYGAYLTQGIVSEHLQMKHYGSDKQRFKHLEALNGAQVCWLGGNGRCPIDDDPRQSDDLQWINNINIDDVCRDNCQAQQQALHCFCMHRL